MMLPMLEPVPALCIDRVENSASLVCHPEGAWNLPQFHTPTEPVRGRPPNPKGTVTHPDLTFPNS